MAKIKTDDIDEVPEEVQPMVRWLKGTAEEFGAQSASWENHDETIDITFTFDKGEFDDGV